MKIAGKAIKKAAQTSLFRFFASSFEKLPWPESNVLRVLTYHRIATKNERLDLDPSLISASPESFDRQMEWISRDFNPVSLANVIEAMKSGNGLSKRSVLVTFDDAYLDFMFHAWPSLVKYNIPVALFVPTDFCSAETSSFWWDQIHDAVNNQSNGGRLRVGQREFSLDNAKTRKRTTKAVKSYLKSLDHHQLQQEVGSILEQVGYTKSKRSVLDWGQLKALSDQGVDLVPHTQSHPLLTRVHASVAREEIINSRRCLNEKIGKVLPAFAYPSGYYNEEVVNILRDEGFKVGFTTVRGVNDLEVTDNLKLRRINIGAETPDALIRLQMCPANLKTQSKVASQFPSV